MRAGQENRDDASELNTYKQVNARKEEKGIPGWGGGEPVEL